VKFALVVALAAALALVAADGASAGSRVAYFKVSLVASQDVSWEKHLTYRTNCGSGFIQLEGQGKSALRIRTPRPQPAVAQLRRNGQVTLRFRGSGAMLPVVGTLTRHGASYATGQTPETTSGCPKPEPPVAPDCGTRRFGGHSSIGVNYLTPADSPDREPDPDLDLGPLTGRDFNLGSLTDAIVLTGPSVPGWRGVVFEWCPGASGDDVLRGPVYERNGARSTPGHLASSWLFGKRRRFSVNEHSNDRVETAPTSGAVSGTFPIKTETDWTLTFRRLARWPSGL
jgi:hypothetical protein